jgi:hypothetical protein
MDIGWHSQAAEWFSVKFVGLTDKLESKSITPDLPVIKKPLMAIQGLFN